MNPHECKRQTFYVVGVRGDSSTHVMSMGLSYEDASFLYEVVLKAEIFPEVFIVPDEPEPASDTAERVATVIPFSSRSNQPADRNRDLHAEA